MFWALQRVIDKAKCTEGEVQKIAESVISEAILISDEDFDNNLAIGKNGSEFINDGDVVLTHCK